MKKSNNKSLKITPVFALNLARESHMYFTELCFSHMLTAKLPALFRVFYQKPEDEHRNIIAYFQGSPFETILLYSHVLWRILGVSEFKNCVIVCGDNQKSREVYRTFCHELLTNKNLKCFNHRIVKQNMNGWSIVFPNHGAKISVITYPKKGYNISHLGSYPDLLIGVDLDNATSNKKVLLDWVQEKFYNNEYLPPNIFILGTTSEEYNLFTNIHKYYKDKQNGETTNVITMPLFSESKECYWKEKYNKNEIKKMLKDYNKKDWQLQYLCHVRQNIEISEMVFNEDGTLNLEKLNSDLVNEERIVYIPLTIYLQLNPYYFEDIAGCGHYGVGTYHNFIPKKDGT